MLMDVSEYDIDVINLANSDTLMQESIKSAFIVLKGESDDISRLLG
jgi:hypothetical protein